LAIVDQMMEEVPNVTTCACGQGAILVTMQAARELGADSASILSYTSSGELPGARKDYVTGFGTVMFYKNE
jgi:AmmeMemoRadiSam system protein B